MFPEGEKEGLYHTADATLWFFHAMRSVSSRRRGDRLTLGAAVSDAEDDRRVARRAARTSASTSIGRDGLLVQGAEGYQLTWMDAKVDDWVVTPRRGKAVEINALWYNALKLMERWAAEHGRSMPSTLRARADRARRSFNERFWYRRRRLPLPTSSTRRRWTGTDDAKCRPNQLLAIALPHPVLDARAMGAGACDVVRDRLLTPVGLRSLAPGDRDFKPRYYGDLRARDAAYHQGTVWGWLVGPFVDAWLKVYPDDDRAARSARSTGSCRISTMRASDRSARCSTRNRRLRREAASLRRGAWRRFSAPWMKVGMFRPTEDDKQIREVASTAVVDRRVQAGASR